MKKAKQVISTFMSLAMALSAAPWQAAAAPVVGPAFLQTFTPPSRLGFVVDSFQGTTKQPIVLIQDLHANVKVQRKIVSMLELFKAPLKAGANEVVLGREAESKEVQLDAYLAKPEKVRVVASEVLLKNAFISAEEHFALTNADTKTRIMGIENQADFDLHDRLTRASFEARMRLAGKLETLRAELDEIRKSGSRDLKRVWAAEEAYLKGEMGLDQLARKLHLPALSYKQTEQAILDRKLELAGKMGKNAEMMKNAVLADHYFSLLVRLFRQQMTLEEVQFAYSKSSEILSVVGAVMPKENLTEWADVFRSAVDYYGVAIMRDKPMAENSIRLAKDHAEQPIAVVAGGFHTDGMTKIFRQQNVSYVVIAPVVESHTLRDEMLYLARSLDVPVDPREYASDLKSAMRNHMKGLPVNPGQVDSTIEQAEKGPGQTPKPNDLMQFAAGSTDLTPFLAAPPPAAAILTEHQALIDGAKAAALGLVGDVPANVEIRVASNRTIERTFTEGNKFVVVLSQEHLNEILKQQREGNAAQTARLNQQLGFALAKGYINAKKNNEGEFESTRELIDAIVKKEGVKGAVEAFEQVSVAGSVKSPFLGGMEALAAAMGPEAQASKDASLKWLQANQGVVYGVVAAMMDAMATQGVTYRDQGQLAEILKAKFGEKADEALKRVQAVTEKASSYMSRSRPSEAQTTAFNDAVKEAIAGAA